ncbi:hypothetical protein M9H77_35713 [Catharanthus roseus]|uniref:Uncharacterized protein n=1 Tax=Catharanthus roseus TaxID=4058 RepID=A0ACB9ZQI8_CATRO|nr:hypothetical protein M9H77_35713 [Catharanthus roseus]
MAMCENWQVFVHDGRHNHAIGVYTHGHAQTAKMTEEYHAPPRNILRFFQEQNVGCVLAQKIYNVVAKSKKNRMQGRNTVEEVLCLSAIRDYRVFYRNCEDNNMLSYIVVAHPTSIEMLRTWSYNPFAHKFVRYWTKSHMHFGVETTNRAESEHSVLKLWLSTCHGDLDIVFFNIDSLIEGQIADIKTSLEFSKTKEKNNSLDIQKDMVGDNESCRDI